MKMRGQAGKLAAIGCVACLCGMSLAGGVATVTRGPYLQLGTATSIVVHWRTSVATTSRVVYGPTPAALTSTVEDAASTTEHILTLTGLEPASTVCYAVGNATDLLAGGDANHCFKTPPLPGTAQPTRLWILGDSGTGNLAARDVRDAYFGYPGADQTDLWLMLGDNAYPNATDEELQSKLFDIFPEMLRRAVLWPAIGNHNGSSDSPTQTGPYFDAFDLPANAEAGGQPSGTEAYYAFDWANVHFAVLDTSDTNVSAGGAMLQWLETDLASTAQDWVVVFFHHPPYSKGSRDSDVQARQILVRESVVPILDDHGVDLTLTGHSHSYERSYLIAGHYGDSTTFLETMKVLPGDGDPDGDGEYAKTVVGPDPHSGIVYTVLGSSGQIDGGDLNHPAMATSLNLHGSVIIDVDGNRLDVRFLDKFGVVLDHCAITKTAPLMQPVANFDADPTTGPVPLSVSFADLSTNAPDSWSWDFDADGFVDSTEQHPTYNYTQPGIYTVQLTAANGAGADDFVMVDAVCAVTARPLPVTGLVFSDPTSLSWSAAADAAAYDVARSDLAGVRAGTGWTGVSACALGPVTETALVDQGLPAPGAGFAYLTRVVDCAGSTRSYDSGGPGQIMPRDVPPAPTCALSL